MQFQRWSVLKNSWLKFNAYVMVTMEKATMIFFFFLNIERFSGPFHHGSSGKNVANDSLQSEKVLDSAT